MPERVDIVKELDLEPVPEGKDAPSDLTIVKRSLQVLLDGEPLHDEWKRGAETIIRKYEEACSTLDPDELAGDIRFEEKTLFDMVKKAIEQREVQNFSTEIPKSQAKAMSLLRKLVRDVIKRIVEEDEEGTLFVKLGLLAEIPEEAIKEAMLDEAQREQISLAISDEVAEEINKDYGVHEFLETVIKAGFTFSLDRSSFYDLLKAPKTGVHFLTSLLGTAFVSLDIDKKAPKEKFPIRLRTIPVSYAYWNADANNMRGSPDERNVNNFTLVYNFANWESFVLSLTEEEKRNLPNGIWGGATIDVAQQDEREDDHSYFQRLKELPGQMVYSIDLLTGQTVKYYGKGYAFGGTALTKKAFPYKMNGENYINVVKFSYLPSARGLLDYGMGHYAVQPHNRNKLMNNGILKGALADINAPFLVNVKEGMEDDFMLRKEMAEQDIENGSLGVIINSFDDNGQPMVQGLQRFTAPFNTGILEAAKRTTSDDQTQVGLRMYETDTPASKTKFALQAEGVAGRSIEETIQEYNASELKFFLEVFLDLCKKVSGDWSLPINDFSTDNELLEMVALNMGWNEFSTIINEYEVIITPEVVMNTRPSEKMKLALLKDSLQYAPIGSQGSAKILQKIISELTDVEVGVDDFVQQEENPQGGTAPAPQ